ncbi:hypothetical protein E2562_037917 [Oryza meyeriana var. granulata]|uniref:Uncharacterized protein n=1 Tax=Oryza meyeriana var. granulata TaxID=110450 RepID=A0A6G1EU06_9ORYZ|nr:hypothetical protein E2562_037917 [Oryza meyeriana var. granulata]
MGGEKPLLISGSGADGGAFAFISKEWHKVRDSVSTDLRQMRAHRLRAGAPPRDRVGAHEPEPVPPLPPVATGAPIAEVEFVQKRI